MHELMIADERERQAEAAAVLLGDGQLEDVRGSAGNEVPHLRPPPATPELDRHGLAGHAGMHEHAGRTPDGDGGALHGQQAGQREGCVAGLRHHELLRQIEGRSGGVLRLVMQPIRSGGQRRQREDGLPLGVVAQGAAGDGRAFGPEAQHLGRRVLRIAARSQVVAGCARTGPCLRASRGQGLLRRQQRLRRLLQRDEAPGAGARAWRSVEVGAQDGEGDRAILEDEAGDVGDARLDGHEPEPEAARGRARLAAFVRHVGFDGIRPRELARGPRVRLGREGKEEAAVGAQARVPRGHDTSRRVERSTPEPPPPGLGGLPRHAPGHVPRGHGEAEVVTDVAAQRRWAVETDLPLGVEQGHLEGGPLVLFDPDQSLAAQRAAHPPTAEQPSRGDRELAGRRAVVVGGHRLRLDDVSTRVDELDGDGRAGRRVEARRFAATLVRDHLPQELLLRAVDAPVRVDEGRVDRFRCAHDRPGDLRGQAHVLAMPREQGQLMALPFPRRYDGAGPREIETDSAIRVRRSGGQRAMSLLPIELPQLDAGARDRRARPAGGGRDLDRVTGRALHEDEVADEQVHGLELVRAGAALEVRARGAHHDVQTRTAQRRRHERAVPPIVGGRRQLGRPLRGRPRALDQLRHLLPGGQEVVVPRHAHPIGEIDGVGAEEEPREVGVLHLDRALARTIEVHGRELIGGRLDGGDDRTALSPADRLRVRRRAGQGEGAGAHERIPRVLLLHEIRERRLAHRPPFEVAHRGKPALQVVANLLAVLARGEGGVQPAEPLEACLEGRLPPSGRGLPGLQVRKDGRELRERVRGGIVEARLYRPQQRGHVEPVQLVLLRAPERGVRQQLDDQVGDRVPHRPPDARGVVAALQVVADAVDRIRTDAVTLRPDARVRTHRLRADLVRRPLLEIQRILRLDALALPDLVGVRLEVVDEGLAMEEVEHGMAGGAGRPRRLAQETDDRLVPVKGAAELRFPDQRARPLVLVAAGLGPGADLRHHCRRRLVLLLADEPVRLFPGRIRGAGDGGGRGRRTRASGGALRRPHPQSQQHDDDGGPTQHRA